MAKPTSIRELRDSGYASRSVKQELRDNLIARLRQGEGLFSGIVGYERPSCPRSRTRSCAARTSSSWASAARPRPAWPRLLVNLLDEEMPALAGCEINDDPFDPICAALPRSWSPSRATRRRSRGCPRDRRYGEKLATPDITIADLIGEVDPIKVAEGRYLSDELTIHYGLLPRTNRGIFAHQRAAGPGRAHPGRPAQHHGRARRADPRLQGPAAARPVRGRQRQPGGLHQPRPHHHPAQGPLRLADPHALPARRVEHEIAIMEQERTAFVDAGLRDRRARST